MRTECGEKVVWELKKPGFGGRLARLTHAPRLAGAEGQERKQFFFEKKNQKTFDLIG
jgi:hypothetical protein